MLTQMGFDHPATFDTLALEPNKKKEITNDLVTFSKAKDHCNKIGKVGKRGICFKGFQGQESPR